MIQKLKSSMWKMHACNQTQRAGWETSAPWYKWQKTPKKSSSYNSMPTFSIKQKKIFFWSWGTTGFYPALHKTWLIIPSCISGITENWIRFSGLNFSPRFYRTPLQKLIIDSLREPARALSWRIIQNSGYMRPAWSCMNMKGNWMLKKQFIMTCAAAVMFHFHFCLTIMWNWLILFSISHFLLIWTITGFLTSLSSAQKLVKDYRWQLTSITSMTINRS